MLTSSGVMRVASLIVARVQIMCGNCPRGGLPGERLGEQALDRFRARKTRLRLSCNPCVDPFPHLLPEARGINRARGASVAVVSDRSFRGLPQPHARPGRPFLGETGTVAIKNSTVPASTISPMKRWPMRSAAPTPS